MQLPADEKGTHMPGAFFEAMLGSVFGCGLALFSLFAFHWANRRFVESGTP